MIIGSGLIASAFSRHADKLAHACLYAAGVSNSSCRVDSEFVRERQRLQTAITHAGSRLLIYFSTCSIEDPWSQTSPYIAHKREMEVLVRQHRRFLIVRLPQVAGRTPNPHTLLNHLYARISRSEQFELWTRAKRNIIDVDDVACLVMELLSEGAAAETINVANPVNTSTLDIVRAFEHVTRRIAVCHALDLGGEYMIDVARIQTAIQRCDIRFDETYLLRTLTKYYG